MLNNAKEQIAVKATTSKGVNLLGPKPVVASLAVITLLLILLNKKRIFRAPRDTGVVVSNRAALQEKEKEDFCDALIEKSPITKLPLHRQQDLRGICIAAYKPMKSNEYKYGNYKSRSLIHL